MSGRLRAITLENYRCFRDPFRLELRPLTLLYGWNNAGKSTAARLIRLLRDSLDANARAPLDAPGDTTYRDLVWKPAVTKPGPLRFASNGQGGTLSASPGVWTMTAMPDECTYETSKSCTPGV